jgi:hypothetical protein
MTIKGMPKRFPIVPTTVAESRIAALIEKSTISHAKIKRRAYSVKVGIVAETSMLEKLFPVRNFPSATMLNVIAAATHCPP